MVSAARFPSAYAWPEHRTIQSAHEILGDAGHVLRLRTVDEAGTDMENLAEVFNREAARSKASVPRTSVRKVPTGP